MAAGAGVLALAAFERARPLRPPREPLWRRDARNLAVAAFAALVVQIVERPLSERAAAFAERRRLGLLRLLPLPKPVERAAAVVLLDYTLYAWHVLLHKVPALWRLHRAHHADLETSASTALRLHFAEMLLSAPWRALQAVVIGADARALQIWRSLTTACILFHHANIRLPLAFERALQAVLVTPRMHGVHHSIVPDEVDSNWGAGLSLWDRLHGTLRLDRPQRPDAMGLPDKRAQEDVGLAQTLAMPFERGLRKRLKRAGTA